MTLTDKIVKFLEEAETRGTEPRLYSGPFIAQKYYEELGMEPDLPVSKWFDNISKRKYPAFASITRAVRKARELHPRWRKEEDQVKAEIKDVKKDVGY